jgi:hypothetical protein
MVGETGRDTMTHLRKISYGGTAAIVTNMALIAGLQQASAPKASIIGSLLIIALADNMTDALSIHVYQESERLEPREAFRATLSNFGTRLGVSLTFILLVALLQPALAAVLCLAWGLALLGGLTWLLAAQRGANVPLEILKHFGAAFAVIATGKAIGASILAYFGG